MRLLGGKSKAEAKPLALAAYVVVKHSWKGKYKRILLISQNAVVTLNPLDNWITTNVFSIGAESDIDGLQVRSRG
jgi:DnaJ family protein C protein 13